MWGPGKQTNPLYSFISTSSSLLAPSFSFLLFPFNFFRVFLLSPSVARAFRPPLSIPIFSSTRYPSSASMFFFLFFPSSLSYSSIPLLHITLLPPDSTSLPLHHLTIFPVFSIILHLFSSYICIFLCYIVAFKLSYLITFHVSS